MALTTERIFYLLNAYTSGKCTAAEEKELLDWMSEAPEESELKTYVKKQWDAPRTNADAVNVDWNKMFETIIRSDKAIPIDAAPSRTSIGWRRIVAAASIVLLLLGAGIIYFLLAPEKKFARVTEKQNQVQDQDVAAPAANKAVLKLANGREIILDNARDGSLEQQGVSNAYKLGSDELIYSPQNNARVELHTLDVPRGSKPVQLQLADGSQVWINVGSSITFPNIFTGSNRKVTIKGEAYFEIKKDAGRKFLVEANGTTTEVLGTHFNINSYANEVAVKITLLEGSVKVQKSGRSATLKPGHQALCSNENIQLMTNIDTSEVLAWKHGLFEFIDTDIQSVMRQIERWYDVEVIFAGTVTQHFTGTIQRAVNVSQVLKMLEKTGGVRFAVEGKKIVVKNY